MSGGTCQVTAVCHSKALLAIALLSVTQYILKIGIPKVGLQCEVTSKALQLRSSHFVWMLSKSSAARCADHAAETMYDTLDPGPSVPSQAGGPLGELLNDGGLQVLLGRQCGHILWLEP